MWTINLGHVLQAERALKAVEEDRFEGWMREKEKYRKEEDGKIKRSRHGVEYIGFLDKVGERG